jgi:single-strand DNA-binding protein
MRYSPSGTAIATFSLATNHGQKSQDGEWIDKTEWHNILAFGKTAEIVGEYLKKGKQVYLEGRLQTSSWEDQQGQKKYKTEVVVSEVQMIGAKGEGESGQQESAAPAKSAPGETPPPVSEEEDDLPF